MTESGCQLFPQLGSRNKAMIGLSTSAFLIKSDSRTFNELIPGRPSNLTLEKTINCASSRAEKAATAANSV
jgi:hypothetical protein